MTTQYTPILKLALPVTGELSGTWGDIVNDNITSMIEQAIAGLATVSTWTTNSHTLTTANGTTSESRCAMLVAQNGAGLSAAGEIVCPATSKLYVLKNSTSYAITLKTAAGTGVSVPSGQTAFLFCDGTNVNACVTTIVDGNISGNLTVSGNATIDGNTTLGNALGDIVTINGTATFVNAAPTLSTLTASQAVFTNGSKQLVSNAITGTGDVVMSASPTLTGTVGAASLTLSSLTSGRVTYAGASGLLQDSANLTFNGTDLTVSGAVNAGSVNATTLDLTNLEVTNIKAKDGTASMTLADATGVATFSANPVLNAGTANGVLYLDGSKVATSGSALTFDGTNFATTGIANIGNGARIQGSGSITGTGVGAEIFASGGVTYYTSYDRTGAAYAPLQYISGTYQAWNVGGEQMRLTSTGLGIGTISPGAKLEVSSPAATSAAAALRAGSTDSVYMTLGRNAYEAGIGVTGSTVLLTGASAGDLNIYTNTAGGNIRLSAGNTGFIQATLDSSGNLGIGTSSPGAKLDVVGTAAISGAVTLSGGTANGVLYLDGSKVATSGSALTFDGTNFLVGVASLTPPSVGTTAPWANVSNGNNGALLLGPANTGTAFWHDNGGDTVTTIRNLYASTSANAQLRLQAGFLTFHAGTALSEQMRLTSSLLSVVPGATIEGLTVGRGAGAVSTNTAVGASALAANTTAVENAAFGYYALKDNTGQTNTAVGAYAAYLTTTGNGVSAFGNSALQSNTSGTDITGVGKLALQANTTGSYNTAVGRSALHSNTTASNNTAVGYQAAYSNTTGYSNAAFGTYSMYSTSTATDGTAIGYRALFNNTTGVENTAIGSNALHQNTTGDRMVAVGVNALYNSTAGNSVAVGWQAGYSATSASITAFGYYAARNTTTGVGNTAIGDQALSTNTTGAASTAVGGLALANNTTANYNTGIGYQAAYNNTTGSSVTAVGYQAGFANTTGSNLAAFGVQAGFSNTTGLYNAFLGTNAARSNTTGSYLTAVGEQALFSNTTASNNTAVGYQAAYSNTTATRNTAIGMQALYSNATDNDNTAVGYQSQYAITGGQNTTLGTYAFYSGAGNNNVAIGYLAMGDSGKNGNSNVAIGSSALQKATTANTNVAIGQSAMINTTTGAQNTAVGCYSMLGNTTGLYNVAVGFQSFYNNQTGEGTTAIGYQAGYSSVNTAGNGFNTFIGRVAGYATTTAIDTVFVGNASGYSNTTGTDNVALGSVALYSNTTGSYNTALGRQALFQNTTASNNTAVGYQAGYSNTTGQYNVMLGHTAGYSATSSAEQVYIGYRAGYNFTAGNGNIAIGYEAAYNSSGVSKTGAYNILIGGTVTNTQNGPGYSMTSGSYNTMIGSGSGQAVTTGISNIFLGYRSGDEMTTGSQNVIIGRFSGNQGGLDIRTLSNHIVLSDGDGNPRLNCTANGDWAIEPAAAGASTGVYRGIYASYGAGLSGMAGEASLVNNLYYDSGSYRFLATNSGGGGAVCINYQGIITGRGVGGTGAVAGAATTPISLFSVGPGGTFGLEGSVGSTAGTGITFPATQNASSNANTLDDYEEGTWTPILQGAGADPTGVTYSTQSGSYTKIGNLVTVNFYLSFSTFTGGSGVASVGGLPFTTKSSTYGEGAIKIENISLPSGRTYATISAFATVAYAGLYSAGSNTVWAGLELGTEVTSSGTTKYVTGTLTYLAS